MPTLKTLTYFDWHEVTKEVEQIAGKDVRNWADKSSRTGDSNYTNPYLDFWHEMIDYMPEISNGVYVWLDFLDAIEYYESVKDKTWVADILKIYHAVVGVDEATFKMAW